jgi:hypothetical protein
MTDDTALRALHEEELDRTISEELTDDQLQQLAEGASSWGASCTAGGSTCPQGPAS